MLEIFKFFFSCVPSCSFLQYSSDLYLTVSLSHHLVCLWLVSSLWCSMPFLLFPACFKFSQLSCHLLNLTIWRSSFYFFSFNGKVFQTTGMSRATGRLAELRQRQYEVFLCTYHWHFLQLIPRLIETVDLRIKYQYSLYLAPRIFTSYSIEKIILSSHLTKSGLIIGFS